METIELQLTADLFKDAEFWSSDCPIGRASKKHFPHSYITVAGGGVYIGQNTNYHQNEYRKFEPWYLEPQFREDEKKARDKSFSSSEIIRTITLKPV